MRDPFVELGGWIIAQAIEDTLGKDEATQEEVNDAWKFLLYDPVVDDVLDYIDYGFIKEGYSKREFIIKVVIPQKAIEYAELIGKKNNKQKEEVIT